MNSKLTAKKALEIAKSNGYSLGRNGKQGYYIGFVSPEIHVIRWQLAPEFTLKQVIEYIQANPVR
jgi:hypothetical protein